MPELNPNYQKAVQALENYAKQKGCTIVTRQEVIKAITEELSCYSDDVKKLLETVSKNHPFSTILKKAGFSSA